jgi:hypothetical protein
VWVSFDAISRKPLGQHLKLVGAMLDKRADPPSLTRQWVVRGRETWRRQGARFQLSGRHILLVQGLWASDVREVLDSASPLGFRGREGKRERAAALQDAVATLKARCSIQPFIGKRPTIVHFTFAL